MTSAIPESPYLYQTQTVKVRYTPGDPIDKENIPIFLVSDPAVTRTINLGTCFAETESSRVYDCKDLASGRSYCVKIPQGNSTNIVKMLYEANAYHRAATVPHVFHPEGLYTDGIHIFLLGEKFAGTLHPQQFTSMTKECKDSIASQLLRATWGLSQMGIFSQDLRIGNILYRNVRFNGPLYTDMEIAISDFNISYVMKQAQVAQKIGSISQFLSQYYYEEDGDILHLCLDETPVNGTQVRINQVHHCLTHLFFAQELEEQAHFYSQLYEILDQEQLSQLGRVLYALYTNESELRIPTQKTDRQLTEDILQRYLPKEKNPVMYKLILELFYA